MTTKSSQHNFVEKLKQYQALVAENVAAGKVFMVVGDHPALRSALLNRGWLEKLSPSQSKLLTKGRDMNGLLTGAAYDPTCERVLISKLLEIKPIHFVWKPKAHKLEATETTADQWISCILRSRMTDFTTKAGLLNILELNHWHLIENYSEMRCPRTYSLATDDSKVDFINDYRLTACLTFTHFLATQETIDDFFSGTTGVSKDVVHFAIEQVSMAIKGLQHEFINNNLDEPMLPTNMWNCHLSHIEDILNKKVRIGPVTPKEVEEMLVALRSTVASATAHWPWIPQDGVRNIWIVKPVNQACGTGISLVKTDQDVMRYIDRNRKYKYIVQKYIERPMLIYNTKFDIRQYFIVSIDSNKQLKIWMYKNCYLRFSSQEFSLDKLEISVHLTNHAIQKNYKNGKRDARLPMNNMWSLVEFQYYLRSMDKLKTWDEVTYPGMKKNIRAIVLASMDDTEIVKNTFQLFGADFMIDMNFEPVLIEINGAPDLRPTTCVTERICADVLEDLVKVIIDHGRDARAPTGDFESILDLAIPKVSGYAYNMVVQGKRIKIPLPQSNYRKTVNLATNRKVDTKASVKIKVEVKENKPPRAQVTMKLHDPVREAFNNRFASPIKAPVVVSKSSEISGDSKSNIQQFPFCDKLN